MATTLVKLRAKDIPQYREQLLAQQGGCCALCQEPIEPGKAVLDHDHRSGFVRGVLHRGCNALEGQIVNSLPRNLITPARLAAIFVNWQQYHKTNTEVLHPRAKKPAKKK